MYIKNRDLPKSGKPCHQKLVAIETFSEPLNLPYTKLFPDKFLKKLCLCAAVKGLLMVKVSVGEILF